MKLRAQARRRTAIGGRQFQIRLRPRNAPDRDLLADLRRVARERGRLTVGVYHAHGRFAVGTVSGRFGSWNAALAAAGLPANKLHAIPDLDLFENFAEVWRKLGRQPSREDLRKRPGPSRFSCGPYRSRFGSWRGFLLAFADHVGAAIAGGRARRPRPRRSRRAAGSRRSLSPGLRATVLIRDNCLCRMCGASPAKDPDVTLHVDHIVPVSRGGPTTLDNLQTLCAACNLGKADLLPAPARAAAIPRGLRR